MKKNPFSIKNLLSFGSVLLVLFVFFASANAQFSAVDTAFNSVPAKDAEPALPNFLLLPDGKIITFGFNGTRIFGGVPKNQIARLNADGSLDNSFDCPACDFDVNSAQIQTDGKIVIAGTYSVNGSNPTGRVRRLNADGSVDNSLSNPFSEQVSSAESTYPSVSLIQPDGKILLGVLTSSSGYRYAAIYRLNTDGTFDNTFTTIAFMGGRLSAEYVSRVRLAADGKIVVSGGLNSGLGGGYGFVRRYNADGTTDSTFTAPSFGDASGGSTTLTRVSDFVIQADGGILFVGKFDTVNSISRIAVARILPAGNVDLNFPPTNFFTTGTAADQIALLPDGRYIVGSGGRLFRFNADGTADASFVSPAGYSIVQRFAVDAQGKILVTFGNPQNGGYAYVTRRLNQDGSFDASFAVSLATVGTVSVLASQPDGKLIYGGDFKTIGGIARVNFARVNADGSLDTTFNGGSGFDVAPRVIVVQSDGKILVGGAFTVYDGAARRGIIRLNSDGSLDNSFNTILGDGEIYAIAPRGDGKIYLGGTFTAVNNQTRKGIARLNADGSFDASFNPIFGDSTIRAVIAQSDGKVLIGGTFTGVNGFNRSNLVRLNADGSLDTTFDGGNITGVYQLAIQPDGKYIVLADKLARLNSSGTADSTFQPLTIYGINTSFLLMPDGSLIVGGVFDSINGVRRDNIARLRPDGSLDAFFLRSGTNGAVNALARTADGKVLVGGSFTVISGVTRVAVARLIINPILSVTNGSKPFDYDGDGRADLSVFRPSSGIWYVARPTGIPAQNFNATQFGIATDKIVPADYDGDGKTDIAVYRSGTWYLLQSTAGYTSVQFGTADDIPVPADYDGDGKADLAYYRPGNGTWYLQQSALGYSALAFGISTDRPVPADYNGDGKADLAVYRPSNGFWYIARPTGIPSQNYDSIQFGVASDKTVPADYDGDGKADIAVWRPSNGVWYLRQSTAGFSSVQFGQNGDAPAPADYDGDGKADVSVYRQGIWYLNRSTQGFVGIQFGNGEDTPTPNAFVR